MLVKSRWGDRDDWAFRGPWRIFLNATSKKSAWACLSCTCMFVHITNTIPAQTNQQEARTSSTIMCETLRRSGSSCRRFSSTPTVQYINYNSHRAHYLPVCCTHRHPPKTHTHASQSRERCTLVRGDCRASNLIEYPTRPPTCCSRRSEDKPSIHTDEHSPLPFLWRLSLQSTWQRLGAAE